MGIGFPNPILRLLPGITPKQATLGGTDVGVRVLCVDPVKRAVQSAAQHRPLLRTQKLRYFCASFS
jgi:hypothetical protein